MVSVFVDAGLSARLGKLTLDLFHFSTESVDLVNEVGLVLVLERPR
jgi:hypothetical protein